MDAANSAVEAASLYGKLECVVLPMFYHAPVKYTQIMRTTIAVNGSFFNTRRMLSPYVHNAYQSIEIHLPRK
jgi:glycogen phosphorylase